MSIFDWIESDDAARVSASSTANGCDRGDGYDVDVYRSERTGRYIVRVYYIPSRRSSWYTARSLDDASAVGAAGWTPGNAPGNYRYVSAPDRLAEVRALRTAEVLS